MMNLISAVMPTIRRPSGVSYLNSAVENLSRSGVFISPYLSQFVLIQDHLKAPHLNVINCLLAGYRSGSPWVLFLEDDIDVCGDFLGSVARWLDDYSNSNLIYTFGCTNPVVSSLHRKGIYNFEYPSSGFYGTQAIAVRRSNVPSLVDYLSTSTRSSGTYDLMIGDWAKSIQGPDSKFLASSPSFVQHLGESSSIRPGTVAHKFESWQGREWTYDVRVR